MLVAGRAFFVGPCCAVGGPLTPLIPVPTPNFACNSPTTISNFEFRSLELQRFRPLLKLLPIELHASFLEATRGNTVPPPTSTAARPSGPSGALHTSGTGSLMCGWARCFDSRPSLPSFLNPHLISHAIPLRLLQVLNSDRWNCNVFQTLSKLHPIELHATFLEGRP